MYLVSVLCDNGTLGRRVEISFSTKTGRNLNTCAIDLYSILILESRQAWGGAKYVQLFVSLSIRIFLKRPRRPSPTVCLAFIVHHPRCATIRSSDEVKSSPWNLESLLSLDGKKKKKKEGGGVHRSYSGVEPSMKGWKAYSYLYLYRVEEVLESMKYLSCCRTWKKNWNDFRRPSSEMCKINHS